MRKILIIGFVALLSLVLAYGFADAAVKGMCSNCHTMHNSQNGTSMAYDGTGGPNPYLTRGYSATSKCLGCHGVNFGGATNIYAVNVAPQVIHKATIDLAGGNFTYIATGGKSGTTGDQETRGHNVKDLGGSGVPDDNFGLNYPPGWQSVVGSGITNDNFTCSGTKGCHGNRTVDDEMQAVKGGHHESDVILKFGSSFTLTGQGSTVGKSYRFLMGVKGAEDSDWQDTSLPSDHNEYFGTATPGTGSETTSPLNGTISGLCAECHGYFHGSAATETGGSASPWKRHPTDFQLPSDTAKEYASYNPDNANEYRLEAPLARPSGFFANALASSSDIGVPAGDTTNAIVMCLSCHGAHASANADILRWNYEGMIAGSDTSDTGCFTCHTRKNAD